MTIEFHADKHDIGAYEFPGEVIVVPRSAHASILKVLGVPLPVQESRSLHSLLATITVTGGPLNSMKMKIEVAHTCKVNSMQFKINGVPHVTLRVGQTDVGNEFALAHLVRQFREPNDQSLADYAWTRKGGGCRFALSRRDGFRAVDRPADRFSVRYERRNTDSHALECDGRRVSLGIWRSRRAAVRLRA